MRTGEEEATVLTQTVLYPQMFSPSNVFSETKWDRQNRSLRRILSYFFYLKKTFRKEVRSYKSIKVLV